MKWDLKVKIMSIKRLTTIALSLCAFAMTVPVSAQENNILEDAEMEAMTDTVQYSLEYNPSHQASDWVNPETGRSGAVVPIRTFENAQGRPCREFITSIMIGDKEEQGYGTACRQPDGSWEIIAEDRQGQQPSPEVSREVYRYAPPTEYYRYPAGFYGAYPVYLSFSTVYRSGRLYRGLFYLSGTEFHHRHPRKIRQRVFVGPRVYNYYPWRKVWKHRERFEHHGPGLRWDYNGQRGGNRDWDKKKRKNKSRD